MVTRNGHRGLLNNHNKILTQLNSS